MTCYSTKRVGDSRQYGNDLWIYDTVGRNLRRLTNDHDEEKEVDFSPDGRWVSFVRGNNLFVVDAAKGGEKQLTRDGREGDKAIYNGYLDWVYEEEVYGRGKKRAYWWSTRFAVRRFSAPRRGTGAKIYNPQRHTDRPECRDNILSAGRRSQSARSSRVFADVGKNWVVPNAGRIPKLGEKLPPSLVRFGDADRFIDTSAYKPEDLLIVRVAWSPDSRAVIFQAQNREQTYLDLNAGHARR
jgi:dipeptidyl-peptidase-4